MTEMVRLTRVPRRVRLRVEDYLSLDGAGAFEAYGRTELLDGSVVYMNAQHRPHARIKGRLYGAIQDALRRIGSNLEGLIEGSVAMPPHDVPEPDISLTSEPDGDGLIPLASLALVIEIADATIRTDLGRKLRLYARESVAEYWVIDVRKRVIHQFWHPDARTYTERRDMAFGDQIVSATIPNLVVATDGL